MEQTDHYESGLFQPTLWLSSAVALGITLVDCTGQQLQLETVLHLK